MQWYRNLGQTARYTIAIVGALALVLPVASYVVAYARLPGQVEVLTERTQSNAKAIGVVAQRSVRSDLMSRIRTCRGKASRDMTRIERAVANCQGLGEDIRRFLRNPPVNMSPEEIADAFQSERVQPSSLSDVGSNQ